MRWGTRYWDSLGRFQGARAAPPPLPCLSALFLLGRKGCASMLASPVFLWDESKTSCFIHLTNMVALSASLACTDHSPLSIASMASSLGLEEVVHNHNNTYPYYHNWGREARQKECSMQDLLGRGSSYCYQWTVHWSPLLDIKQPIDCWAREIV